MVRRSGEEEKANRKIADPRAVLPRGRRRVGSLPETRRLPSLGNQTQAVDPAVLVFAWGNNARRRELRGRRCVIEARGTMGTVLVRFLDTGERVTTSYRALRHE